MCRSAIFLRHLMPDRHDFAKNEHGKRLELGLNIRLNLTRESI